MEFKLAYGPLAYLHILHIKDPSRRFKVSDLLHFVPSALLDIGFFTGSFVYLRSHMDWAYENIPLIQAIALFIALIGTVQLGVYTYLIYKQSQDTKVLLKEFRLVRKWLSLLMASWGLVIGFMMIAIPLGLVFIAQLDHNSEWLYKPLGALNSLWIYVLGYYYLLKYVRVIRNYMDKIGKFTFSDTELDHRKHQILQALQENGLYKDPNLTLAKLAGFLGWPINTVSKIINETLQTNFNDLINRHRVSAFKELALSPQSERYSILGLGQECGFRSKASFYRVFKKETGMTPTEYMKSQA